MRHQHLLVSAMLASSSLPLAEIPLQRPVVPPTSRTQERLEKAEKKRVRKMAQRARLAAKLYGAMKRGGDHG